ncbi:mitochondrial import receptor subunit TOM40 homolog 1-like [Aricia agestis]|uniref:mitochondrial import receptor subunit TOM40 homolog 1-like n=1 Tax=Aricia agestis TaxID=91739 RepID=UPI001C202735|nr:mitochondrial import receptor subunit TOM40 homolog 1-like [Aricia agestis]
MGGVGSRFRVYNSGLTSVDAPNVEDANKRENPGTIDELHKKTKEVMPVNFEGGKLIVNKGISNHFQMSHTLTMSSMQSGYKLGGTYIGTKQISPTEAFPVMLGEVDPSGNVNCNFVHQLTPDVRLKAAAQIQECKLTATQGTVEYKGSDYTIAMAYAKPDFSEKSSVLVGQYLQSVTRRLALGAELVYQASPRVPGGEIAVASGAARYTMDDSEVSATVSPASFHICYFKQASEQLQVVAEMETSFRGMESTGTIGYQVTIPKADLVFRGMVDSNWTIGAVLEKKLQPLPFTFALSGMANQAKQQFKFGCGFYIG